jgi:CubicO group peptidase (beta-lactamase class C family)
MSGDAIFGQLDAKLAAFADERDFSGIARISAAGDTAFEACYGLANRADSVPIRPGTRFGTASVTKMFTAVAVVDLIGQGLLDFDRPVVEILPPERRPNTLGPDVTVAHLLSHTSEIGDYYDEDDDDVGDYSGLWANLPTQRMRRPADFLPMFTDVAPYGPPGKKFHYSNAGYIVLALVIEELAQAPFADVIARRVFDRAGMRDSGFFALDEVRPDLATGYMAPTESGGLWRSNIASIPIIGGGDGGAYCTAADLDRFISAYDAGTLVGPALRDVMLTPRCDVAPGLTMGYGVIRYEGDRTWRFGHGGGDPGFELFVMRFPELDVNAVVMCNVEGIAGEVRDLLVEAVVATS